MSRLTVDDFLNGTLGASVRYIYVRKQDFEQNKLFARVLSFCGGLIGEGAPTVEQKNEYTDSNGAIARLNKTAVVRALARQLVQDAFLEKQANYTLRTGNLRPPDYLAFGRFQFDTSVDKSPRFDSKLCTITVLIEKEIPLGGMACCFQCRLLDSKPLFSLVADAAPASLNSNSDSFSSPTAALSSSTGHSTAAPRNPSLGERVVNVWLETLIGIDTAYLIEIWRGALHHRRRIDATVIWLNSNQTECFIADPLGDRGVTTPPASRVVLTDQ